VTNKSGQFKLDQSFQEAKLSLIPGNECKKYHTKSMGFLPSRELCAANKYIRRIDRYEYYKYLKRKKPRANQKCPFCPRFRRLKLANRVKDKEIKYGETDSCSGDSGGPLWKWMGKSNQKATVPHLHTEKHLVIAIALIFNASKVRHQIS
jgi:hypothetical protein